jgi:hypothetical protein
MAKAEHLVASTRYRFQGLLEPEMATWLWVHLWATVPGVLALVLMPDHLHLMARPGAHTSFRKVLAAFTGVRGIAFDLCPPEPANTLAIAGRQLRYIFLNPVRAGLVDDPYCWAWSSLRELVGAAFPAQVELAELAAFLDCSPARCLRGLTASMKGHAEPPRTTLPLTADPIAITTAVAACLRLPEPHVRSARLGRRLAIQTAAHLQIPPPAKAMAQHLGITPRGARALRTPEHSGTEAALRCLADARMQHRPLGG